MVNNDFYYFSLMLLLVSACVNVLTLCSLLGKERDLYSRNKLRVRKRVSIPVGAVVELEVLENIVIPKGSYGTFHLRKQFAMKGLFQAVTTPFPDDFEGKPIVVVENRGVVPVEVMLGEEIGELWIFGG